MNNYAKKLRESNVWDKEFVDWDDAFDNAVLKSDDIAIQNKAAMAIFRSGHIIDSLMNEFLANFDLSIPQKNVLESLYFCKRNDMTQDELSKFVYTSKGNLSTLLSRMESKGLIKKVEDPNNKRRNKISITKEGVNKIELIMDNMDESQFDFLTDDESEKIVKILSKFKHNLLKRGSIMKNEKK